MATILFLGASISQFSAIRKAKAVGHRVVAVDGDPNAVGFALADATEAVDFTDVARVVDVGRRHHVDGVVAISTDRAVPVAAAVAEALGLPGIGSETARVMTDKPAMRARLRERGVAQPPYLEIAHDVDPVEALHLVGTPAVLKPADSGGQRGVYEINDVSELAEQLSTTLAFSRTGRAILERYVEGRELNGIVVVRAGTPTLITLSDRLRPAGPGFGVGWIHLYPSELDPAQLDAAATVALDAVRALGLRDGIGFPQILVTEAGEPFVVEVAARVPAGQMADLVRHGTGVDLVDIALRQALGLPVDDAAITPRLDRPIAIRFLTASPGVLPTGTVLSIDRLDHVRSAPGVLDAGLYFGVGETITPVQVDADRRGYVIATAGTPRDALELADRAATELVIRVAETATR